MPRDSREPDQEVEGRRAPGAAPPSPLLEAGLPHALRRREVCPIRLRRELLRASSGLCPTHAEAVLRVTPPDVATWLVSDLERRVRPRQAEVAAFFRALDYRFAHEATGREKTVWRTIARYLRGARPA